MQKIKNSIVAKMIEVGVTSKEFDFLIYISRFQDESGKIDGVHYKDVCESMHISYQGFYDIKKSLVEKGIIATEKTNRIDHDITIIGNSFVGVENFQETENHYINTNQNIFLSEEFFKLKVGTKLLAMEMMKISFAGKGHAVIGMKKFYDKYCAMFQVSKRVMRGYLMQLKKFFSVGLKDGKYFITPLVKVYRTPKTKTENERYAEHQVKVICRRNHMNVTDKKAIRDTAKLEGQYKSRALDANMDIWRLMKQVIEASLEKMNIAYKTYKIRDIKPKLIHKLLKEVLV